MEVAIWLVNGEHQTFDFGYATVEAVEAGYGGRISPSDKFCAYSGA